MEEYHINAVASILVRIHITQEHKSTFGEREDVLSSKYRTVFKMHRRTKLIRRHVLMLSMVRARFAPAAPAASLATTPRRGGCAPSSGFGGMGHLRPEAVRAPALFLPGRECQSQLSLFFHW